MNSEPTNCNTCQASLENGFVYKYRGDELIEAHCRECNDKTTFENYINTKRLSSHLVMDNSLNLYHTNMKKDWNFENDNFLEQLRTRCEIAISVSKIQKKIKNFEKEVWFKGLQNTVRASTMKGVSAIINNFYVLTYTMCGRTMITIQDDTASVTLITDETSETSCAGLHGIDATEEKALSLIQMAIELFGDKHLTFKEDNVVSIGF